MADVGRNAGVSHACRQAGKRLGAAQADRQLEYLQGIEEFERRRLAAGDIERKRRARAGALPLEQEPGRRVFVEVTKVMDFGHLGVVAQVIRHEPRIRVRFFHADAECFERTAKHPAGMRVQLGADGSAQRPDVCDPSTGETLVERCPGCLQRLTWSNVTDVARCGTCRLRLWGIEPKMPEGDEVELAEFFCNLFSPTPDVRKAFRDRLPTSLGAWPEGAILELVHVLGRFEASVRRPRTAPVPNDLGNSLRGIRTVLGGLQSIGQIVTAPLNHARQSKDRLAATISFALASSTIHSSRSALVRELLRELLTRAP